MEKNKFMDSTNTVIPIEDSQSPIKIQSTLNQTQELKTGPQIGEDSDNNAQLKKTELVIKQSNNTNLQSSILKSDKFNEDEVLPLIIEILKKPSEDRKDSETRLLQKFTIRLEFFQKLEAQAKKCHSKSLTNNTHKECCRVMTLQQYKKDDLIIKFGDDPECFYIILDGEC